MTMGWISFIGIVPTPTYRVLHTIAELRTEYYSLPQTVSLRKYTYILRDDLIWDLTDFYRI